VDQAAEGSQHAILTEQAARGSTRTKPSGSDFETARESCQAISMAPTVETARESCQARSRRTKGGPTLQQVVHRLVSGPSSAWSPHSLDSLFLQPPVLASTCAQRSPPRRGTGLRMRPSHNVRTQSQALARMWPRPLSALAPMLICMVQAANVRACIPMPIALHSRSGRWCQVVVV
jgi:hypothetical protein